MEYLFQGKLDNTVHEITCDQLKQLYDDNLQETKESEEITASSYRGESYYTEGGNLNYEFEKEILQRNPKTAGMKMYYPHGVIIQQAARRNYYRGENQIYPSSIPSLLRTLKKYKSQKEKELYRIVADMRVAEFSHLLNQFQHVKNWNVSDVLYEVLAQHYGLETSWLDITDDFNVALFFATCYWDGSQWRPLTKEQTEIDEAHQYGMIFHMPSNRMPVRWISAAEQFSTFTSHPVSKDDKGMDVYGRLVHPVYKGPVVNVIYPIGFQPFMRCHMQSGYGMYMRTPSPLQNDFEFEKLKFRHNEELSQWVFEAMNGGELIYPHEGLKQAQFIINQIAKATVFSEEAFHYALYRNHLYKISDADIVRNELKDFIVDGKPIEIISGHSWHITPGRRNRIDSVYQNFSIENWYGIKILDRQQLPGPNPMFEPWMIPEEHDGEGIKDFKVRDSINCGQSILIRNTQSILSIIKYAKLPDF